MASGSGSSSTSSRPSRIASPDRSGRVSDVAGRRGVALVEHEIDDMQHGVEPIRQFVARRHLIRNAARRESCSSRGRCAGRRVGGGGEKGVRDLLGLEAADFAQRQRDARVGIQRRMAAGEDQPQAIVVDAVLVERRVSRAARSRSSRVARSRRRAASNRRARRMRSIALNRPVETSHARGLAGTPSRGHVRAPPRRRRASLPRRDRNRRAGGSASRARGASRIDRCLRSARDASSSAIVRC